MKKLDERSQFSARLQLTLTEKGWKANSPTWLSRQFNMRFDGSAITVQTASNWLNGAAIPSQDKLKVLSAWLEVNAEWLRYGEQKETTDIVYQGVEYFGITDLPEKIEQLTPKQKKAVYDVVNAMLKSD